MCDGGYLRTSERVSFVRERAGERQRDIERERGGEGGSWSFREAQACAAPERSQQAVVVSGRRTWSEFLSGCARGRAVL